MLVESRAVEALQCPRVGCEMAGHPVDQHPDARLMQLVHQMSELIRRHRTWTVVRSNR